VASTSRSHPHTIERAHTHTCVYCCHDFPPHANINFHANTHAHTHTHFHMHVLVITLTQSHVRSLLNPLSFFLLPSLSRVRSFSLSLSLSFCLFVTHTSARIFLTQFHLTFSYRLFERKRETPVLPLNCSFSIARAHAHTHPSLPHTTSRLLCTHCMPARRWNTIASRVHIREFLTCYYMHIFYERP